MTWLLRVHARCACRKNKTGAAILTLFSWLYQECEPVHWGRTGSCCNHSFGHGTTEQHINSCTKIQSLDCKAHPCTLSSFTHFITAWSTIQEKTSWNRLLPRSQSRICRIRHLLYAKLRSPNYLQWPGIQFLTVVRIKSFKDIHNWDESPIIQAPRLWRWIKWPSVASNVKQGHFGSWLVIHV